MALRTRLFGTGTGFKASHAAVLCPKEWPVIPTMIKSTLVY